MQISQWHHCPHNNCDSNFKSKSDLKHHTEANETLDSGKTYPCDLCDYVGKAAKRLADHKQRHKEHRCNHAGCDAIFDHHQKLLNHRKKENNFSVVLFYCHFVCHYNGIKVTLIVN